MDFNSAHEEPARVVAGKTGLRLDEQIVNVIAGRTAFGEASSMPRLSVAPQSKLAALAEDYINTMLILLEPRVPAAHTDPFRTALIWKMLDYFSKTGLRRGTPSALSNLHHAMLWLCHHPHAIADAIGFAKIIELGEAMATAANAKRRSFAATQLEPLRLEMNPPSRPVAWEDGPYRLERLNHPFHFFEEGVRMKNCLAEVPKIEIMPGDFAISAACLHDSVCWWVNKNAYSDIYSFRVHDGFAATLELRNSVIMQFHLAFQDQPQLFPVLARALYDAEGMAGPIEILVVNQDGFALRSALNNARPA